MNSTQQVNEKQITTGKNKLRHRIQELETEVSNLHQQIVETKALEEERFKAKYAGLESAVDEMLLKVRETLAAAGKVLNTLYGEAR